MRRRTERIRKTSSRDDFYDFVFFGRKVVGWPVRRARNDRGDLHVRVRPNQATVSVPISYDIDLLAAAVNRPSTNRPRPYVPHPRTQWVVIHRVFRNCVRIFRVARAPAAVVPGPFNDNRRPTRRSVDTVRRGAGGTGTRLGPRVDARGGPNNVSRRFGFVSKPIDVVTNFAGRHDCVDKFRSNGGASNV